MTDSTEITSILEHQIWQDGEGKMSNAKLYSLYKILTSNSLKFTKAKIQHHEKHYRSCDRDSKADNLEIACRYLKFRLTNDERKIINIPDSQWTKWRCMFCWFIKSTM